MYFHKVQMCYWDNKNNNNKNIYIYILFLIFLALQWW